MKKEKKPYLQKLGYVAFALVFTGLMYQIFELSIHTYLCDSEENTGSCLLASRLYKNQDNSSEEENYLRKSCEGKYALGCSDLGKFLINTGRQEEGQKNLDLACELGHKPACQN